ncbi:enhancer of polycomb homolog 2-like isoform X3 [Salvelinus alpinus]|uniref:enhancer of polycomb homolog 2-like isoform X3 n=1 Tax=Salvelinus alpinus TaxID=8036 RepID=UPI0039FBF488
MEEPGRASCVRAGYRSCRVVIVGAGCRSCRVVIVGAGCRSCRVVIVGAGCRSCRVVIVGAGCRSCRVVIVGAGCRSCRVVIVGAGCRSCRVVIVGAGCRSCRVVIVGAGCRSCRVVIVGAGCRSCRVVIVGAGYRYQMGDFTGEVLSEVTAPLAEKPVYTVPITVTNGNRHNHKAEIKIKTHKSGGLQHHGYHHVSVKDEDPFDFVRPKKKYTRREPLCRPGRPAKRQHIVNKADIKQYDFHSSGEEDYPLSPPSEPDEENDPDGTFAFRRKAGCHYLAVSLTAITTPCLDQTSGLLWDHPELAGLDALRHRQSLTALSVPQRCVGLARRRVGRGGRVLLDRASSDLDGVLKQLDSAVFSSSFPKGLSAVPELSDHQVPSQNHRTMPGSASSLTDLLSNIQALRWRFFRPRSTQGDGSGEGRTGRPSMDNRLSGGLFVHTKNSGSGGITEEQYQVHQQALAQMQKQQLAQLQLKAPPPQQHFSLPERQNTQTAGSTDCIISKTLDSAGAHFAASAVISAPGQVNNENKPDNTSVNGVVQPLGTSRPPHSTSTSQGGTGLDRSGRTPSSGGPLLPASHSTAPQSLPNHRGHGSAVSPAHHHHNARPSPSALKLATMAASSLERVPKVTPAIGSMARDNHEPERLALNGISETTVPMEVT